MLRFDEGKTIEISKRRYLPTRLLDNFKGDPANLVADDAKAMYTHIAEIRADSANPAGVFMIAISFKPESSDRE